VSGVLQESIGLSFFDPLVAEWFEQKVSAATEPQILGIGVTSHHLLFHALNSPLEGLPTTRAEHR
jgi:hypothetical protein